MHTMKSSVSLGTSLTRWLRVERRKTARVEPEHGPCHHHVSAGQTRERRQALIARQPNGVVLTQRVVVTRRNDITRGKEPGRPEIARSFVRAAAI